MARGFNVPSHNFSTFVPTRGMPEFRLAKPGRTHLVRHGSAEQRALSSARAAPNCCRVPPVQVSPLDRGLPGSHRIDDHADGLDHDWGVVDHDVVS
jgi:hypothetical protein